MSIVVRTAQDVAGNVGARIEHTTNRLLPPKQRERALENLRVFSNRNPKLASFLVAQIALAGLPVLLFLAFAVATLVVSLVTCVLLGGIAALVFTLFTTGFALLLVVPAVFVGSCTASMAFLWGLVGYLMLQRINGGEAPVQPGTKVGDTLNELTGGRLRDMADRADADAHQEELVIDPPRDTEVPMGRESRSGYHETRGSSPHRRLNGQTNGSGYGGETGEASEKSGARGAQVRTRSYPDQIAARNTRMTEQNTFAESAVDWKTEFQREGLKA